MNTLPPKTNQRPPSVSRKMVFDLKSSLANMMKLLWSNPNPSADFAAQEITLDLSEYNFIYVEFVSTCVSNPIIHVGGVGNRALTVGGSSTGWFVAYRTIAASSTKVQFGNGVRYENNGTSYTTKNNECIPLSIWGFK